MQLYVGGFSSVTLEDELALAFSRFGAVESVEIVRDFQSGESKGFGTVRMTDDAEGEEAITQLNGTLLDGQKIMVSRMPDTLPGEFGVRQWLTENARQVLIKVGIRDRQMVLDYGCGPGTFTLAAAGIVGKDGKVYALDVRPRALERIREKAGSEKIENIETILMDTTGFATGLSDETIDVILLYDVFHDIKDRRGLLQELHRVLRPEGILSVFPMHVGTAALLDIMNEFGLFRLRDRCGPEGYQAASEVLNFQKNRPG
ncbi:MAG TPA: methyltransferase domain-containing protein [Dehalococcoidia bacterium]|nr:methyltransferase domain-containing protein [Dehalococcoidia bacterium]